MSSVVPEGWEVKRLDEYCYRVTDGTHDSPKRTNEGVRLVTSKNLKRGKLDFSSAYFISHTDFAEIEKRSKVEAGDVLFGMIGTIGNPVIVKNLSTPFAIKNVALFKFNGDLTKARWLQFYLDSNDFKLYVERSQTGNAQSFLGLGFLRETLLPVPPLPEQKKIASILTSVDEVIENTQKQIDKLQDLKKATMNELLTKGIGHTEFKDSELGRIPKSWEVKKVSQFTKEHKQGFYTKDGYQGNGVFLIRITDLQNPKINYSEMPKLPVSEKDFTSFKVDVGDFLFARSGAIGRYGIVSENYPAVFASYLIRFKFNDTVYAKFFGYMYESEYCQNQLSYITQGSSNININAENIKSLTVPYPSLVEQRKIASVLLSIDKNIEDKHHKLFQTQSLKKSLMQDLLTGKVRVTVN